MFAYMATDMTLPNPHTCYLLSADAWDVPESSWDTSAIGYVNYPNGTGTVGPKSGCRRPDWSC